MSTDAWRTAAGRGQVGRRCEWCGAVLGGGEDTAICIACDAVHHGRCWDQHGGCGWRGCLNAPPGRQTPAPAGRPDAAPRGDIVCDRCGAPLPAAATACAVCGTRAGGREPLEGARARPPRRIRVEEATTALVAGLAGLVSLGFVLGPLAILSGRRALRRIAANRFRADPIYTGGDLARAGILLGLLATVVHLGLAALYVLALFDPARYNPFLPVPLPEDALEQLLDFLLGNWRLLRGD
ncbi:MAG: hypothetical protein JXQ29_08615 [Planctomycetes bacterium]|nr:hypothetical protein [Planctomycetota bacterium]